MGGETLLHTPSHGGGTDGPQKTGYHGSWGEAYGDICEVSWEAYGDICEVYMLCLFSRNSLCLRSTYFSVHMLCFIFLKNSIKQNKTKHLAGKQNPNQGQLARNSTLGCGLCSRPELGQVTELAEQVTIWIPAVPLARVWLSDVISTDRLVPPMTRQNVFRKGPFLSQVGTKMPSICLLCYTG